MAISTAALHFANSRGMTTPVGGGLFFHGMLVFANESVLRRPRASCGSGGLAHEGEHAVRFRIPSQSIDIANIAIKGDASNREIL